MAERLYNDGQGREFGGFGQLNDPMSPFTAALQASIDAQKEANALAAFASVPRADSESARAAGDERRRKLLSGSNFGIGLPDLLGAPPVGFRMLSGE